MYHRIIIGIATTGTIIALTMPLLASAACDVTAISTKLNEAAQALQAGNTTLAAQKISEAATLLASCDQSGSFQEGSRVKTTTNLRVRQTPSPTGVTLILAPEGSKGTIRCSQSQGFTCPLIQGDYTWWYVDYDGSLPSGWSAEVAPGETNKPYLVLDTSTSPSPTPPPPGPVPPNPSTPPTPPVTPPPVPPTTTELKMDPDGPSGPMAPQSGTVESKLIGLNVRGLPITVPNVGVVGDMTVIGQSSFGALRQLGANFIADLSWSSSGTSCALQEIMPSTPNPAPTKYSHSGYFMHLYLGAPDGSSAAPTPDLSYFPKSQVTFSYPNLPAAGKAKFQLPDSPGRNVKFVLTCGGQTSQLIAGVAYANMSTGAGLGDFLDNSVLVTGSSIDGPVAVSVKGVTDWMNYPNNWNIGWEPIGPPVGFGDVVSKAFCSENFCWGSFVWNALNANRCVATATKQSGGIDTLPREVASGSQDNPSRAQWGGMSGALTMKTAFLGCRVCSGPQEFWTSVTVTCSNASGQSASKTIPIQQ